MKKPPFVDWIHEYKKEFLRGDILAGVIVAIMLVPQGMAYAILAGLPPVTGLYASTIPLLLYAFSGSSRHLAVGPVAMTSLLVYAGCAPLAEPGSPEYMRYVLLLAFMVGITQLALGVFRMGFIVNYVSHAAISGFTSAAAIVIFLSQLKRLLGLNLVASHSTPQLAIDVARHIGETRFSALVIGIAGIAIMVFSRRKFPRFPAPLLVVMGGALCAWFFKLDKAGLSIVGNVPRGLPDFSIPAFESKTIIALFPTALTIVFVGYMESIAVAQLIASREKYKVSPNREFIGLGAANVAAAFFSGYPVTGGFSRTAINYEAGAKTPLASIMTAFLALFTLLFLTPLFYYLPYSVLAAIITVAVLGLVNVTEAIRLFRIKKSDGSILFLTFILTLSLGIEKGIIAGVVLSLVLFIWRSSHPHMAELGFLEKEGVFRDVKRYSGAKTFPGILILRIDASLYFANMAFIENHLRHRIEDRPDLKCIIFDMEGVNDIDAVAVTVLEEMMKQYESRGIRFLFASMKGPVRDLVLRARWHEKFGDSFQYLSIQKALDHIPFN
ncbi:solute carrier family 26 protein [Candidatus Sumerlaeota bacterium]|nr:solute carrier family 26 protein [Candidatus Sumerlaeota bacterium]